MAKASKRARSAKTGRFVTLADALKHPFTTVLEAVRRRKP